MLASDLVNGALRLIGAIASGETPNSDEAADGLTALQQLLDSWSGQELMIFATAIQTVSMTAGTQSYTLPTRPVKILSADVNLGTINIPVEVVGPEQWAKIPDKSASSAMMKAVFCDYGFTSAKVYVAPIPNSQTSALNLYCTVDLATLSNGSSTFSMPESYSRAIMYNLAVDLAPQYGRTVDQALMLRANETMQALMKLIASDKAGKSELELPTGGN